MKATEWWKNEMFAPFFGGKKAAPTQQQLPSNIVPIGAAKGGSYGYTGKGADGVTQPERRVPGIGGGAYDAHESEFVMDANTTQAIGPDVLAQVMKAAKSGKLDLNKLREAVGMEQKPGFQTGGAAPAIGAGQYDLLNQYKQNDKSPSDNKPGKLQNINVPSTNNATRGSAPAIGAPARTKSPSVGPNDLDPIKPDPIQPSIIPEQQVIGPNNLDPIKPDVVTPSAIKQQTITANPLTLTKPAQINPAAQNIGVLPSPIGKKQDIQAKVPAALIGKKQDIQAKVPPMLDKNAAIKAINTLPVEVQEELNKQNIPQQDIIDYFMGIMKGDNPYFKMLQDLLGQKIGGAGAAASAAMKQEAAMSGWGKEQLSSLGMARQRDVEGNASQAIGQLATQQAGMGMEAANKLWGMQQDINQQQNWEKQFGLSKEQWEKEFGWQKESWEKSFDYTKLTDAQKNEQWQQMFDNDNSKWQKTWDESLKDKDFNKQTDMLNALLASGGEANLKKASEMMKQMFGEDIDFDNALDKEKQGDFNTAWNNMGGLIASNMDWEQALQVMKKDGTFDKLGMTEDDLKKVYDKQKLQNDPVYKMMNQVDSWVEQGIMTKEQGEQYKDLFQWSLTNPDGFEIADGFVLRDSSGNEIGFFKTQKEMEDWMNKNPGQYTTEVMKGHISKKPIGGDGPGPGPGPGQGPIGPDDNVTAGLKNLLGRDLTPEELKNFNENDLDYLNAFKMKDFKSYSTSDLGGMYELYNRLPKDYKDKNKFGDIVSKISPTYEPIVNAIDKGEIITNFTDTKGNVQDTTTALGNFDYWRTNQGLDHWQINGETKVMLDKNMGKYVEYNGKVFKIVDYKDGSKHDRLSYPTITVYDPITNQNYTIGSNDNKKGEQRWADIFQAQETYLTDNKGANFISDYYNSKKPKKG